MTNIEQAVIKVKCENDFEFFVKYFFKHQKGSKFIFSWHHSEICKNLVDVYNGVVTHLMINIPPRYSKTELCVKMFTAWCFVKNPKSEFIHLSYSDGLALDNSETIKTIIKSAEYQALWPDVVIKNNKDSKKAWGTEEGGSFYATASGGSVTGFGAGKIDDFENGNGFGGALIIDDPLKPDDAHSKPRREGVNKRWDETIKSRFNSTKTPCIVIMQRIHEQDFCGMLLEDEEYKFKQLVLPAIIDEGKPTEKALWPKKHSLERLKVMQKKNTYMFSGQMQQMPSPLGGGILKGEWFGYYTVLPKFQWRAIYADTANKKGRYNDYSVLECWGLGVDGYMYLIDILRGKWEAHELEKNAPMFWNKHVNADESQLRHMAVEDKASGTGLIQNIRHNKATKIPIKDIQRSIDKLTRIMDVQGFIESGYIKLPRDAAFTSDFVNECESFTADDTHAFDDQIDPMCDAIQEMLGINTTGFFIG